MPGARHAGHRNKAGSRRTLVPTEPIGTIRVVELAHGYRVDVISILPDGKARHEPEHYPTKALADQFARMMSQATGFTIIKGKGS